MKKLLKFNEFILENRIMIESFNDHYVPCEVGDYKKLSELTEEDGYELIQIDYDVQNLRDEYHLQDDYQYYVVKFEKQGDQTVGELEIWGVEGAKINAEAECLWTAYGDGYGVKQTSSTMSTDIHIAEVGDYRQLSELTEKDGYDIVQAESEVKHIRNSYQLTDDYTFYVVKLEKTYDYITGYTEIWGIDRVNKTTEAECLWVDK